MFCNRFDSVQFRVKSSTPSVATGILASGFTGQFFSHVNNRISPLFRLQHRSTFKSNFPSIVAVYGPIVFSLSWLILSNNTSASDKSYCVLTAASFGCSFSRIWLIASRRVIWEYKSRQWKDYGAINRNNGGKIWLESAAMLQAKKWKAATKRCSS